jgi:hypothetical protein
MSIRLLLQVKQGNCDMKNDTAVFAAMRFDALAGKNVWTGLTGTRQAIRRDGYCIDPLSLNFCPHQWIDSRGYVDLESVGDAPAEAGMLPNRARTLWAPNSAGRPALRPGHAPAAIVARRLNEEHFWTTTPAFDRWNATDRKPALSVKTGASNGVQGTFTGGIGAVGRGTKWGGPDASAESAATATIRIASQRIHARYDGILIANVKHLTPPTARSCVDLATLTLFRGMEGDFGLHPSDEVMVALKCTGAEGRFLFQTILSPVGRWTYFQRPFRERAYIPQPAPEQRLAEWSHPTVDYRFVTCSDAANCIP